VARDSKYENTINTWETSTSNSKMDSANKLKDFKTTLKRYYKNNSQLHGNRAGNEKFIMNVTNDKSCGYCGKKGHNEAQCWKKHPELRPKSKGNGDGSNSNDKKNKGPCWICGGAHKKKEYPRYKGNKSDVNDGSIILDRLKKNNENSNHENKVQSLRFQADSDSMTHAICDDSIELENEEKTNDKVRGFDGSVVYIKTKGNLKVKYTSTNSTMELKNVMKSKLIKKNIISIGQLQKEGWVLSGKDNILTLKKKNQVLRFAKSDKEDNLYYMEAETVPSINVMAEKGKYC